MKSHYFACLLCISVPSTVFAESSDLSTDIIFPEQNLWGSGPPESIPGYDFDMLDRMGLPVQPPRPIPPRIAPPSLEVLSLAQAKLNFFQRTSLKLEYLLGWIAALYPEARLAVTVATAAYKFFTSDAKTTQSELVEIVQVLCKDMCNIFQIARMLESQIVDLDRIVTQGRADLATMSNATMDPMIESFARSVGMFEVSNNCGEEILVAIYYELLDRRMGTAGFYNFLPGERAFLYNNSLPLLSKGTYYFLHTRTKSGNILKTKDALGGAPSSFIVNGQLLVADTIMGRRGEYGDWIVTPCG